MLSAWKQFVLLAATLGAMLLTAKMFSKSEAKAEKKGDGALEGRKLASTPGLLAQRDPVPSISIEVKSPPAEATPSM